MSAIIRGPSTLGILTIIPRKLLVLPVGIPPSRFVNFTGPPEPRDSLQAVKVTSGRAIRPEEQIMSDAQKATNEPGSPTGTTTLSGKQLPAPDPKFGGGIDQKAS